MREQENRLWMPDYCRLLAANFLLMSSGNLLTGVFSLFLVARGGTDLHIGIASYLFAGAALVVRPVAGWYLDHRSRRVLVALGAAALLRGVHYHTVPPERQTPFRDERLRDLLYERDALPAAILEGFIAFLSGAISLYLTLYLTLRGDIANPGWFFTFQACGTFASCIFVGRISDRWGEAPLVYSSAGLFAASLLLLVFGETQGAIFLAAVLLGIGYGFTVTGFQIMSVRIVPPERSGSAASTYSCGWDVFTAFGGLFGGILASLMSYRALFVAMLLVLPLFVLSYVCVFSRHPSAFRNCRERTRG